MKRIPRIILLVIALCLLCVPAAALAESDYEEGDGWIYRDGELKVITNNGLINFLYHEFDVRGDPQHKHTADDVDHVIIGKDVTDIVIDYFIGDCNPSSTTIEEGNPCFIIDQGWVVNKQTKTLFGAANVKENKTKTVVDNIPDYIEQIGMYAFSDCHALEQVSMPNNVISIGQSCFHDCGSLTSITLPSATTSIGVGSFSGCTALSQINFSSNIEDIQRAAFTACLNLEVPALFHTQFKEINSDTFWGCDTFQVVELPSTLEKVGEAAFMLCNNLQTLVFHSDHLRIENKAFYVCESLRSLVFTKGKPDYIGDTLFGEDERTPDGKSYITRFYDANGETFPYPTLYYTAAYADEWSPNGETEWNGYQIQQISQEELDAILAEARGEEAPTVSVSPVPTDIPQVETPKPDSITKSPAPLLNTETLLLFAIGTTAIAVVVIAVVRKRNSK